MTKVKEICREFVIYLHSDDGMTLDEAFDQWLQTPQAKSLIGELGGDWVSVPKYLEFEEIDDATIKVFFKENKKFLGYLFFADSDWYWEASGTGGWSWYILKEISDELKLLNESLPQHLK